MYEDRTQNVFELPGDGANPHPIAVVSHRHCICVPPGIPEGGGQFLQRIRIASNADC